MLAADKDLKRAGAKDPRRPRQGSRRPGSLAVAPGLQQPGLLSLGLSSPHPRPHSLAPLWQPGCCVRCAGRWGGKRVQEREVGLQRSEQRGPVGTGCLALNSDGLIPGLHVGVTPSVTSGCHLTRTAQTMPRGPRSGAQGLSDASPRWVTGSSSFTLLSLFPHLSVEP